MPLVSTTRGYMGKGPLFIQRKGSTEAPIAIGNCKALSYKVETERKARIDYQGAGGGELDVQERIKSVSGEMTVDDFKPENIARALRGTVSEVASAAVTGETVTLYAKARAFFEYIPDPAAPVTVAIAVTATRQANTAYALGAKIVQGGRLYGVVVAGTTGSSAPTWPTNLGTVVDGTVTWQDMGPTTLTENTHWKRTRSGIEALPAATQFDAYGTPLTVSYTRNAQYLIQALTDAGSEWLMVFDGLNEIDSGNPVVGKMYRVKFSPTDGLDLIGDEFGELKLSFSVLKDETVTGSGLSQYMQFAMV